MNKFFSFFFLVLIPFLACNSDRCESVNVGSVNLLEDSVHYLPYTDGETLVFQSQNGKQLNFVVDTIHETGRICVEYLCELTADPFQSVPCEYYEAEGRRNVLRSTGDTLIIDMILGVENYEEESVLFYDLFGMHFSGIGGLASGYHIVDAQFSDPTLDPENVFFDPLLEEIDMIEIEGQTFIDVLKTEAGSSEIIFKAGEGVLVLKYQDVYYFAI